MSGSNLSREEARDRAANITVNSYTIELDLCRGEEVFGSTTTVTFRAAEGSSSFIDAISDRVHEVVLNGQSLDPSQIADGARIQLPQLAAENQLRIVADMRYTNTGEGLHRFVDPVDEQVYLYSQFEVPDSRRVFAVFEQPDLKASFQFTVTAPSEWVVVSNSPNPEPEVTADGRHGTWRFAPTERISSYITAIIAGPYQHVHDEYRDANGRVVPLGVYARASLMEYLDADNVFALTKQGFAFYEENFGTPYPFAKYDQLFVPEFNAGAMENAGAVTFLERYIFRGKVADSIVERRAITILHELAHMWFGDLVTMRWWNDLWLNESFAEFMSTLAAAEATEFTQAWTTFLATEKSWAYRQDQLPSTHPIVAPIRDLEDVLVNFDGITYAKGASVLKQLVAWVGQDEFMTGVRAYFAAHAWGNTELSDLLRELETASGRDLSSWSQLWLETAGVNTLRTELVTDEAGNITSFAVLQEAPEDYPTLRPHRLAIGCYDLDASGALVRTHQVELDVDGARTEVPALVGLQGGARSETAQASRPALILLNDKDLAYAKIRLDAESWAAARKYLSRFSDSLPRALVWSAAWDATRDGEIPAREYLDLVLGNISAETDSSVISTLLRQTQSAIWFYVAIEDRITLQNHTASALLDLARAAEPGSDAQLQFVQFFASLAGDASQLEIIASWLRGEQVPAGLVIDQDLRWQLLTALAAGGQLSEAEIDIELEKDNTQSGQLAAAEAKAAIPTTAAKQRAWDAMMAGELPNATLRAYIAGFNRVQNPEMLASFSAQYFAAISQLWAVKSHEIASTIATGLYPAQQVSAETLAASDDFLASIDPEQTGLRRLVVESRDAVARAIRAQESDRGAAITRGAVATGETVK